MSEELKRCPFCVPDMRWRDVSVEKPTEAQQVLFVRGGKVHFGAWINDIFWYSNQKVCALYWMPLPSAPGSSPAAPTEGASVCKRCNGTRIVDDGEITGEGGCEFSNGPIKRVTDCPDCYPTEGACDALVQRDEREATAANRVMDAQVDSMPPDWVERDRMERDKQISTHAAQQVQAAAGAVDTFARAKAIVETWPGWKREFTLTPYSPATESDKVQADADVGTALYQIKLTGDSESVWRDAAESAYHHTTEKNRRAVYAHPDPLLAEAVEIIASLVVPHGGTVAVARDHDKAIAARAFLAKVQAAKEGNSAAPQPAPATGDERKALRIELCEFFMPIDGGYAMDYSGEKIIDRVLEIARRGSAASGDASDALSDDEIMDIAISEGACGWMNPYVSNAEMISFGRALLRASAAHRWEDQRDAERYRWLRDAHPADKSLWVAMGAPGIGLSCWRNEDLDSAIDSAIQRMEKE